MRTSTQATPTEAILERGQVPIIEIVGLAKRYGDFTAVDGIDLTVYEGEIFGILGPNGAGKTTTLEMIEGLRTPDAGTIRVAGLDAVADSARVRQIIGVQLQSTALFDYLNARELIELFAALYGVDASKGRVDELLGLVGLEEKSGAPARDLSGGQRQRLSITLALVNRPRVAFLDEPTTGLDPSARRDLWQVIRDVRAAGTTVVLTTHYMEEAQVLCDRAAILDRGRIIALDTPNGLISALGIEATIAARVTGGQIPGGALEALPAASRAEVVAGRILLQTRDVQATLLGLMQVVERSGVTLAELTSSQSTLEDVFLSLTGRQYEGTDVEESGSREVGPEGGWRGRRSRRDGG
jgi:ABC-2 type transport system ATP-binding protein